jgi:spermidine synthase
MTGRPRSRRPLLLVFVLSGAAALVYQVIWQRELALVFGSTTPSVAVVLSAFMGGLAAGSALARRWLVGSANPLRAFAWLEGVIGAYAILFSSLVRTAEAAYSALLGDETSLAVATLARTAFAFALLGPPTTLMGATLPLLTEALHRFEIDRGDWNAGRLYAANTLGAAFGALASGFLGIELLGIRGTTQVAAALNGVVMATALWLSARGPSGGARPDAPLEASPDPPPYGLFFLAFFSATGALALAGEVVWTRALATLLGSSTYAFSSILIVYLVGIALGSWLAAGVVRRIAHPERWLLGSVLAIGAWHCLAVPLVGGLRLVALSVLGGGSPGLAPVLVIYLGLLSVMLPPALASGALFPAITRLAGGAAGDRGDPIARAYVWNTLGAIAGALLAGFALAPFFVPFHGPYVLAIAATLLGGAAAVVLARLGHRRYAAGGAIAALLLGALAGDALRRDDLYVRAMHRYHPETLVESHSSDLQGTTTVLRARSGDRRADQLLVNGAGMTLKGFVTKAMAHIPIALHGDAQGTLVICFGMGTSYRSALSHGGRVDVVELVPGVLRAFGSFYDDAGDVSRNPRGRMLVNDGRNFLLLTERRYDVITIDPPPPIDGAGVNHLYSREFLELVRAHLKPGGVVAHFVPSISRFSGVPDAWTRDLVIRTFASVFPHVRLVQGSQGAGIHLIGSERPLRVDPDRIDAILGRPEVTRDLVEFAWDRFDRAAFLRAPDVEVAADPSLPILSDDRPLLEFHLLRGARAGRFSALFRLFL